MVSQPPMSTSVVIAGLVCAVLGVAMVPPGAAETQRFTVEAGKSRVGFDAYHPLGDFTATSEAPTGEFQLDTADLKQPIQGSLSVSAESLRSRDKGRDKDIRRALDAEHHPEIRYQIEAVESSFPTLAENNDVLLTIRGILSVRGVARSVTFTGRMRLRPGGALWVRGEGWLRPSDFGAPLLRSWLISMKDGVLATFDLILNKAQ
jgi:polyisoprenoid-binding protein YceI